MSEVLIVFMREFVSRVRTRAFVLGTLLVPVFMAATIVLPAMGNRGAERNFVVVNEASPALGAAFVETLQSGPRSERDNTYRLDLRQAAWLDVRSELDRDVLANRIDGYIVVPEDVQSSAQVHYRARSLASTLVVRDLQMAASQARQAERAQAAGMNGDDLRQLLRPVRVQGARLTEKGEQQGSPAAAIFTAYLVAFLIYMLIVIYGVGILRSILEEKQQRIAEVVLSSITAEKFLAGKLFGVGSAAMLQALIWLAMAALLFGSGAVSGLGIPTAVLANMSLDPGVVALMFAYFVLGFFFYASFFAAIGAMVSSEQEAQSLQTLAILPTVLPLMFIVSLTNDPGSRLASVLSLVPFTSPIGMPVRLAAAPVAPLEIAASMAILVIALVAMIWLAGKIYRIGVLSTGKKPSMREVWGWVRAG
jgi:ABC-2 type transport system permease protein